MLTILTTAKPFVGQIRVSQINALKSWKAISPDVEIILFGDGVGYSQIAQELGLIWIENVETSEQGTPTVNSMFSLARQYGRFPIQMYVNCDIIILDHLPTVLERMPADRFLMIGQRWDLDCEFEIQFEDPRWKQLLEHTVQERATLHPPAGSDYFIYKGDIWKDIPDLIIGRAGYDNQLIYHCRANRIPVIDASQVLRVIHQNHDYGHHPEGLTGVWYGAEAQANRVHIPDAFIFTLVDADWQVTRKGMLKSYARGDWFRYLRATQVLRHKRWDGYLLQGLFRFLNLISRAKSKVMRLILYE